MKIFNKNSIRISASISFILSIYLPTVAFAAGPTPINLLSSSNFEILSETGISTTGTTLVTGDIGVSPVSATYITGFGLNLPAASPFSTSALVVGKVYAADYHTPTPANLTAAISDMEAAYNEGIRRVNPDYIRLGSGNIGGMTLTPGLYKWSTDLRIPSDITLSGSADDIWIFQIIGNLTVTSMAKVILNGGAQANNIFWVVAGQTTLGSYSTFNGNILDQTAIILNTGARLNGRAFAQSAVTLDSNSVNFPAVIAQTPAISIAPVIATTSAPVASVNPPTYSDSVYSIPVATKTETNVSATTSIASSTFGQQIKTIAISLGQGTRGGNVTILQQFLISQNKGPAAQALAKASATAYFGAITKAALAEFQAKVGISPSSGNFGPITRAYISSHY